MDQKSQKFGHVICQNLHVLVFSTLTFIFGIPHNLEKDASDIFPTYCKKNCENSSRLRLVSQKKLLKCHKIPQFSTV